MKRWLLALLGLALAASAIVALVTARPRAPRGPGAEPRPHGEFDDASRQALERVLRDAEHDSERPR